MVAWLVLVFLTGKESIACIKRLSEVAGTCKGSPGEETGNCHTPVHAGIGECTD